MNPFITLSSHDFVFGVDIEQLPVGYEYTISIKGNFPSLAIEFPSTTTEKRSIDEINLQQQSMDCIMEVSNKITRSQF